MRCPECEYNLSGLKHDRCPEYGHNFISRDARTPETRHPLRIAAVDLLGLGLTIGVNVVLLTIVAAAVISGKSSWFTDPIVSLGWRRPSSLSSMLLIVLALSLTAWGWAWEQSSMDSWRTQNALAIWCWLLTTFHAIGTASVVL